MIIRPALREEIPECAAIVASGLRDDPVLAVVVPRRGDRDRQLTAFYTAGFLRGAFLTGVVDTARAEEGGPILGAAAWVAPAPRPRTLAQRLGIAAPGPLGTIAQRLGVAAPGPLGTIAQRLGIAPGPLGTLAQRLGHAAPGPLGTLAQRLGLAPGPLGTLAQRLGLAPRPLGTLAQRLGIAAPGRLGATVRQLPLLVQAHGPIGLVAAAARRATAHRPHPDEPHWYLSDIAVATTARRRGIGSALLDHRLSRVHEPAYLEATTPASQRLYQRFGFEVVAKIGLTPEGYPVAMVTR
ncbi:GNAT family N-acetyltransferase [Cryptosporangium sp. NPDC048952]|uniref:GNAT family N-acetyltransferase n=1 Tax=Cryptosporangium sp. NPDC048952 TaxID=3363961 RepID=UPI00371C0616